MPGLLQSVTLGSRIYPAFAPLLTGKFSRSRYLRMACGHTCVYMPVSNTPSYGLSTASLR